MEKDIWKNDFENAGKPLTNFVRVDASRENKIQVVYQGNITK